MAAPDSEVRAEAEGRSAAGARWAAVKELERLHPDAAIEDVRFETVEEGERDGEDYVRVAAAVGGEEGKAAWEAQTEAADEEPADEELEEEEPGEEEPADEEPGEEEPADEELEEEEPADEEPADEEPADEEPDRGIVSAEEVRELVSIEWPDEPAERVKAVVAAVVASFGVEGSISVEEEDEELVAAVEGEDVGLLIGRHGQTIDAVQLICTQLAYRGHEERKRVVVDAGGYRGRRTEALERQADRAASEAVSSGRAMELDPMSAQERRIVHSHLKDRPEVATHSEGEEPYRFVVVSPLGS